MSERNTASEPREASGRDTEPRCERCGADAERAVHWRTREHGVVCGECHDHLYEGIGG